MYSDKSLTPAETMRLCVLGALTEGPVPYNEIASGVRRFVERMVGPSLDLLGSSLEVLRLEGLIEPVGGKTGDTVPMVLTDAGRSSFETLMQAPIRAPVNDIQRLVLALKLRYIDQLAGEDQLDQLDMLIQVTETELARLRDLKVHEGKAMFKDWLSDEIAHNEARLKWLEAAVEAREVTA